MRHLPWLALALALFGNLACTPLLQAQTPAPQDVAVKEGPGKEVFLARCSNCHALTDITSKRKTRQAWDLKIREMIVFGAEVPSDDIKTITDYLSAQYGM